ncbi:glycosyltransferase family 2 protein [Psychromarinibacter sp. S121]|uniref:glycosyltransferase family 2 protein n=1 Tax=Psychromarinibacter sp. S121 TaxID=3415127 RepID=UPI003C7C579D
MTDAPTVSIVLPVHNREVLVRRAIDSVLAQTRQDFELIVIDDCSTDRTVEVVREYCSDPRVRLELNTTNLGPAGARNRGIELARGRYVAFQDSDDRWFPEKLAMQVQAMEDAPDCRASYCGALYYSAAQCYYIPRLSVFDIGDAAQGDISEAVLHTNPTTPQTLMAERTLFEDVGGFDTSLRINEDWELAIRLAQKAKFAFVEEPLVVIYRTANSVSSDKVADTAFRKKLLTDYADLYAKYPEARARQNYIIGGQSIENAATRDAVEYFRRSYRDSPSLKSLIQIWRARLLRLGGANSSSEPR